MHRPWDIYDALIDAIPANVNVSAAGVGPQWCRVVSSENSMGMAFAFPGTSRPQVYQGKSFVGAPLREIAELAKSWNFAEAGIGVAAINAWYAQPEFSEGNGFVPCTDNAWNRVFHSYSEAVTGKNVYVIGHFPFAPEPLARAAQLNVLERRPQEGDYPDPACEYLLPESDYVFISSSAFVNKTMPRLLRLSRDATTVILGPSTPLSTRLFDCGVDVITGFVPHDSGELFRCLEEPMHSDMYRYAYRVEQTRR